MQVDEQHTEKAGSFTAAIQALQELGEAAATAELVSGMQSNDELTWRHVWVEHNGKVLDAASGTSLEVPGALYYGAMRITERVSMPGAEVLGILRSLGTMKPRAAKRLMLHLMRRLHLPPPARVLSALM